MDNILDLTAHTQTEQKSADQYDLDLEKHTQALIACQEKKALTSCFDCESLLDCQVRTGYVAAAYHSLNQGKQTDFDF